MQKKLQKGAPQPAFEAELSNNLFITTAADAAAYKNTLVNCMFLYALHWHDAEDDFKGEAARLHQLYLLMGDMETYLQQQ